MSLMTVKEVSQWLQVKPSTLYVWAEQGMIPHLKLGRLLRFEHDEIDMWLQAHRRDDTPATAPRRRRSGIDCVDTLIAAAKREVHNPFHGKPDQDRASRKGDDRGSL
ncbi:MAG: helix-turn-helix domain-containing protein [Nitrospirales bacterium]